MESGLRSRKRKQRSSESNAFAGIFTRRRSQIYVHQHRSGYARADAVRSHNLNRNLSKSVETTAKSLAPQKSSEGTVGRMPTNVSVKDLRMRRVFSPSSGTDEVASAGSIGLDSDLNVDKADERNPNLSSATEDPVDSDLGVPVADDLNYSPENIPDPALVREKDGAVDSDLGVSVASGLNPSSENISAPPSARENHVMDADELVQRSPSAPVVDENKGAVEENGIIYAVNEIVDTKVSISRSQSSANNLRGRRKVFKSPSSFSYRRLLPYLMDLGKDDTNSSKFEIVETTLAGKAQKSNNVSSNMVASKDEDTVSEADGRKLADNGVVNTVKSFDRQCSNPMDTDIRACVSLGDSAVEQKNHQDDAKMEECEQSTPPDADIFCKANVDKSLDVLATPSGATTVKYDGITTKNLITESNDFLPTPKPALNPCSRRRILQTPSSFSHRRLLPYLMSTAIDDSNSSKVVQCLKGEKDVEQNPQPETRSLLHQDTKSNSDSGNLSTGHEKSDSLISALIPTDSSPDKITLGILVPSEISFHTNGPDMVSQLVVNSEDETDSSTKFEQGSPENKMTFVQDSNSALSSCSMTMPETLPITPAVEAAELCPFDTHNDSMGLKTSSSEDKRKPFEIDIHQSSSQMVPFDSAGTYGENLRKGILKRNPRGCRGICNCLNCMSFRLHAERAFEFSKNQMQDAEEVALELIKDLTSVRGILEKTAADPSYLATLAEKQVKEVCAKALHTEELAKTRLEQMKEDVTFHCRSTNLLRPKVSFANKIEEKVISKSGRL